MTQTPRSYYPSDARGNTSGYGFSGADLRSAPARPQSNFDRNAPYYK